MPARRLINCGLWMFWNVPVINGFRQIVEYNLVFEPRSGEIEEVVAVREGLEEEEKGVKNDSEICRKKSYAINN